MAGALILVAALLATTSAGSSCDSTCERAAAEALLSRGQSREAVERLRAAVAAYPREVALVLLLARAYLDEGNLFWAERTLRQALVTLPGDPTVSAWLASVHLRQGDPDLVAADLPQEGRPEAGPARARWSLLGAWQAVLQGDVETAAARLKEVPRDARLFPEDRAQWLALHDRVDATWVTPLTATAAVDAGWTSNALAGAPTDPGEVGAGSGLGRLELDGRLVPPTAGVRPLLDLEVLGEAFEDDAARELSTLDASVRLGAMFPGRRQRTSVAYRAGILLLDQDDAWYAETHRLEIEVEGGGGWVAFAGAGKRDYRDRRRSRWEADLGVGGAVGSLGGSPVILGATARTADADSPAYDQIGVTVAAAARLVLGHGTSGRLVVTGSWDDYPNSGGALGREIFGTSDRRRDLQGRLVVEIVRKVRPGLAVRLEARTSVRDSSADDAPGFDFDSRETRVLLGLRWQVSSDPWAPSSVRPDDHVTLDWALGGAEREGDGSILDLLRQDEELRRGSSCGVR